MMAMAGKNIRQLLPQLHPQSRPLRPVFLTTNPHTLPKPELVFSEHVWSHLQYTDKSIAAQKRINEIQGKDRIWYAGGWMGFGFHEDAVGSGLTIARALGCEFPELPMWERPDW